MMHQKYPLSCRWCRFAAYLLAHDFSKLIRSRRKFDQKLIYARAHATKRQRFILFVYRAADNDAALTENTRCRAQLQLNCQRTACTALKLIRFFFLFIVCFSGGVDRRATIRQLRRSHYATSRWGCCCTVTVRVLLSCREFSERRERGIWQSVAQFCIVDNSFPRQSEVIKSERIICIYRKKNRFGESERNFMQIDEHERVCECAVVAYSYIMLNENSFCCSRFYIENDIIFSVVFFCFVRMRRQSS